MGGMALGVNVIVFDVVNPDIVYAEPRRAFSVPRRAGNNGSGSGNRSLICS